MHMNSRITFTLLTAILLGLMACAKRGATDEQQAAAASAQQAPAPAPQASDRQVADIAQSGQRKLIRVSTIKGTEANAEFQRNVQLVQTQRQNIINLNNQLEQEVDATARQNIQAQIDQALAKLNENNQKMLKTYGFSLTRNYMYVYEKAHVYMQVSGEEAARIQAVQQGGN